jgi:ribonuclease VapC
MEGRKVVLDSSAVIALIKREQGADIVIQHLSDAVLSSVNLIEIATYLGRSLPFEAVEKVLASLELSVISCDESQAMLAAVMAGEGRNYGLSLGDRACLALAKLYKLPVLTADKIWQKLDRGVEVRVIR